MAQLFVTLRGGFGTLAGSGRNEQGEDLEWPAWRGAEIGLHPTYGDVLGAVPEAEARDWNIGIEHPLYRGFLPTYLRFTDRDAAQRRAALEQAAAAADSGHQVGGRFIIFHYPHPVLVEPGRNYRGWSLTETPDSVDDWTEAGLLEVSRRAFDFLANLQEEAHIRIGLKLDGPSQLSYGGDLASRLFSEFPSLSICLDTARLRLIAETHGFDALAACDGWLPWARYVHLHSGRWAADGRFQMHLPTLPGDLEAEMARRVVAVQSKATLVLEQDIRLVSSEHSAESHQFAADLVGASTDPGEGQ